MSTYFANVIALSSASGWTAINTNDSATVIKPMMINNGSTNYVVLRRKSNTNVSALFGNGTFSLPRANPGDIEVRSNDTNAVSVLVFTGCPENPA